jgi:2-polyprenyl-3-methyl-5-hydroxy-6-metoxy-1,4-benzoquinol methylase
LKEFELYEENSFNLRSNSQWRKMQEQTFAARMIEEERSSPGEQDYFAYHRERYAYVLAKCRAHKPDRATRVLDIGRSRLSNLLCEHYDHVVTMGFPLSGYESANISPAPVEHIVFDLNTVRDAEQFGRRDKFDLIVFGETIEHLTVAPELVLNFLRGLLAPSGLIVCQTPNAVALHKRIIMLAGRNPYERLRFDPYNPGHIREYTMREVIEIGERAGLRMVEHEFRDYFGVQGPLLRRFAIHSLKLIARLMPSFGRGQTVIYAAKETGSDAHCANAGSL